MKKEGTSSDNKYGFASFILGLFTVIFFFTVIPPLIMGITGTVFSLIQIKKKNNKWALAGLILSIIGIILAVILLIFFVKMISTTSLIIECSQNPSSEACSKLQEISPEFQQYVTCFQNPQAPGCTELLNSNPY
ncbi:DUF4190 domain-containing protein [Candidatus Pacearchaeota archaeon]|nr:DUF4190 domain-containing protein [Candidatus Pacearchaeota archaeon]